MYSDIFLLYYRKTLAKMEHAEIDRHVVRRDTEEQQREKENNDVKVCIFLVTDSNIKRY